MKYLLSKLKFVGTEIIIILGFVIIINSYVGTVDNKINSDAKGYYDYLPSIFIYHDFVRKNDPIQENPNLYKRITDDGIYVNYNQFKVDKYPSGTALLQLPFFMCTYLTFNLEGNVNDGYQNPFQKTVLISTLFYLFLGIFFLKKLLLLYNIKRNTIIFCQIIIVLATPITHYAHLEAGFSHVYSLFAITTFLYFVKMFFLYKSGRDFVFSSIFLGLIFLLRQPNIMIVLFLPFIAGSFSNMWEAIKAILNKPKTLFMGFVLFLGIISIQLFLWFLQTGSFFVYSYQGEGFNFLDPYFISILFSYKKGLFLYTPVLFIATLSLFWLLYKKQFYLFTTWILFFSVLTYILSSWWSWFYGCSFGLRAYIDYFAIFMIPFALMLDGLKKVSRIIIITLSLLTIPLNLIQTYQYKRYILHWIDMDKEKYWKVFLKTNPRYSGLLWKNNYDANMFTCIHEIDAGDICVPKKTDATVFSLKSTDIPDFDQVCFVQVTIEHDFEEHNDTRIVLTFHNPEKKLTYIWNERYLIHFHEKKLNKWQTGLYNFEFNPITDQNANEISIIVKTGNQSEYLKNVRLKFFSYKNL